MKLLALDGNSIVNRAFFGIKLLTTKDGRFTNGIYGFLNILFKLIELESPDGVAVAFDVHAPTFRHELYGQYKAGRKGMPPELREQMPVLKEILTLLGCHCIELPGFEADDILGTLAQGAENSGNQCIISTGDRDSFQLVSDSVTVLLAATKMGHPEITRYTPDAIREKYGVEPMQMIDIKALMGDSSDNIPGVPGVGEKTAMDLIARFHDIDKLYRELDATDIKPGVKAKLIAGKDSAYLSRTLGTISRQVPIATDPTEYKFAPRQDAPLARKLADLELFKLIEKLGLDAAAPSTAPVEEIASSVIYFPATLPEVLTAAETTGKLDLCFPEEGTLLVGAAEKAVRLALGSFGNQSEATLSLDTCLPAAAESLTLLQPALESGSLQKRVADAKSLAHWCHARNIRLQGVAFDLSLAAYLLNPAAKSYDPDRLAAEYGVSAGEGDWAPLTLHTRLCDRLAAEVEFQEMTPLLQDIEIPLAQVLADMEHWGFLVDLEGIRAYGASMEAQIDGLQSAIWQMVGEEFNLNSPKQLGHALFEVLGLPAKKKTKSGYSTNAEVLEELRDAHPAVDAVLKYRQLAKLKSTYCDGMTDKGGADGRIHSTLNQTETRTGRISSTEPNLQNIPVRTPEGRELRKFFKAAEGYVLCDADYSQIELRVLAHMAADQNMINTFLSGEDIHRRTAAQVFHLPEELVTPEMRSSAKAVNFGIVYGISAFSLSKDIGVTRKEAADYIEGYFRTFPGVKAYMEQAVQDATRLGYAKSLYGRRRMLPELAASNAVLRSFGQRVARNMPIQGTAADIIKIAMIRVHRRLQEEQLDARLILQVHDELIVEARTDLADQVCRLLEEEMEAAAQLSVPLSVEAHAGKTWYEAKE